MVVGQQVPLAMAGAGEPVKVVSINAGWGLERRLADMGLTPGVEIKVMNHQMRGPIVINLRGSRLCLGHGIAHKILVEEV